MAEGDPQGRGLRLQMDETGRQLMAVYQAEGEQLPISWNWLEQHIRELGYAGLHFVKGAREELVRKYNSGEKAFELLLAERRDGELKISLSPDRITASLTLMPPAGGQPVSREQLMAALAQERVVFGIDEAAIDAALAAGHCEDLKVAQGIAPQDGRDGRLEPLVSDVKVRVPRIDERGIAHFRDLGGVPVVREGEPLMRRHPPTPGQGGRNVLGQEMPPRPGREVGFGSILAGVAVSPDDPDLLVATVSGQPVIKPEGVQVEAVIKVAEVGMTSGNLDFEGSIKVQGDVKSGMRVKTSGDLIVEGVVEAAHLDVGGNLLVKGGIIGRGGSDSGEQANIRARGSISARFMESARVQAGESVFVDDYLLDSDITAGQQVLVGKDKTRKGSIVGGVVRTRFFLQCRVLGSENQIPATLEIGVDPYVRQRLRQIEERLEKDRAHLADVNKALSFLRNNPAHAREDVLNKASRTHETLLASIARLRGQRDALRRELAMNENARAEVSDHIYPPLTMVMGPLERHIQRESSGGVLRIRENRIVLD